MATIAKLIVQAPARPSTGSQPRRPFLIRFGKKLRRLSDQMLGSSSLVSNEPVLCAQSFPWMTAFQASWREIRDEALAVTRQIADVPPLRSISPDHARIAADDRWRSFFLVGYGARIEENIRLCPRTMAMLERIPGLNSGFFSILGPGTHIPRHRGVSKALLTCHLGLKIPSGDGLRMSVGDRQVGWAPGELLVFDDTYPHEVWNETSDTRIVLLLQFERPLRQPGRAIAAMMLAAIRRSAFVSDAVKNITLFRRQRQGIARAQSD